MRKSAVTNVGIRSLLFTLLWVNCTSWGTSTSLWWPTAPRWHLNLLRIGVLVKIAFIIIIQILQVIILIDHVVLQSLAGKVVDGTGNDLLLQIFTDLIVNFQLLFNFLQLFLFNVAILHSAFGWGNGRGEEVEKTSLLDASFGQGGYDWCFYYAVS